MSTLHISTNNTSYCQEMADVLAEMYRGSPAEKNAQKNNNVEKTNFTSQVTNNIRESYTRELGSVSFEIKRDEDLDPYSISYEDYRNLNYDALEIIFGKDTKQWDEAVGLLTKTDITDDDTLNKIYFDKERETKGEGEESNMYNHTMGMIAFMYGKFEVGLDGSINNQEKFLTTSDKLFEDFDKFQEYFYSDMKDGWTGNIDIKEVFKTMDEIKSLYQTRVEENNALLEQITKNNKPNPIESLNQEVDS